MIVHPGVQRFFPITRHRITSHCNDWQMFIARYLSNPLSRLITIHFGHLDIHQYRMIVIVGDSLQRLLAITGNVNTHPHAFKHLLRYLLIDRIIVDHQQVDTIQVNRRITTLW